MMMEKTMEWIEPEDAAYLLQRMLGRSGTFTPRTAMVRADYSKDEIAQSRRSVTETVSRQDEWDLPSDYEDGSLDKFIGYLREMRALVPAKYRANARYDLESVGGYEGEHHAELAITYTRPETDREVIARLQRTEAMKQFEIERIEDQLRRARARA